MHIHGVSCSAVKHCAGREIVGILPNELKSKQREGKMRHPVKNSPPAGKKTRKRGEDKMKKSRGKSDEKTHDFKY